MNVKHCAGVGDESSGNVAESPTPKPVSPKEPNPDVVDPDEEIEKFEAEQAVGGPRLKDDQKSPQVLEIRVCDTTCVAMFFVCLFKLTNRCFQFVGIRLCD